MSKQAPARANSGKWIILLILLLSCGLILPLSWQAIQAERRQSALMNSMKKSLAGIDKILRQPVCAPNDWLAPSESLLAQTRTIDAAFPRLSLPGSEFTKLSQALVVDSAQFATNAGLATCQSGLQALKQIKNQCSACHKAFGAGPRNKLSTGAPVQ